jgi:hypothetical protein
MPDGQFFVRHIAAESDGSFQDLTTLVSKGKIKIDRKVEAITFGDCHTEKMNWTIASSVWGVGKEKRKYPVMIDVLKPKYGFYEDIIDFEIRNHHSISNIHMRFEQHRHDKDNVEQSLNEAAEFLHGCQRSFCETVIVHSNHDAAYLKWLQNADYREDPENALFFLKSQVKVYQEIEKKNVDFQILEWSFNKYMKKQGRRIKATWLKVDDSFLIAGNIQNANHGDRGAHGARGSLRSFAKTGRKTNTAHSHQAGVIDGAWSAGVSGKLDMGYNQGMSAWSHSHIITMPSGKRQIVTQHADGRWCSDC